MSGVKPIPMLLIATVLLAAIAPRGEAAIGCGAVVSYLNPCIPYVTGNAPLGRCCGGVKGLYNAARTTPDRQSVCNCLKSLARSYSGPSISKASRLPGQCGVRVPYTISPTTDCTKVT